MTWSTAMVGLGIKTNGRYHAGVLSPLTGGLSTPEGCGSQEAKSNYCQQFVFFFWHALQSCDISPSKHKSARYAVCSVPSCRWKGCMYDWVTDMSCNADDIGVWCRRRCTWIGIWRSQFQYMERRQAQRRWEAGVNIGQTTFAGLTEKGFHNSVVATGCLIDLVEVFMLSLRILYHDPLWFRLWANCTCKKKTRAQKSNLRPKRAKNH